jgi:hypothetical protein
MAHRHPELIPHHEPRIVATEGEWTVWEYRGARVRGSGVHNKLMMPEHPYHGKSFGNPELGFKLIGHWLDHGGMHAPFVWPAPRPAPR